MGPSLWSKQRRENDNRPRLLPRAPTIVDSLPIDWNLDLLQDAREAQATLNDETTAEYLRKSTMSWASNKSGR